MTTRPPDLAGSGPGCADAPLGSGRGGPGTTGSGTTGSGRAGPGTTGSGGTRSVSDGSGRSARPRDRGSATVWAATAATALLVVGLVGVDLASAVRARHVAESAADLAALTAAGHATDGPEQACAAARAVVVANGAALRDCGLDGWDATVRVEVERAWTLVGRGPAGATARAGPADPGPDPAGFRTGTRHDHYHGERSPGPGERPVLFAR